MLTFDTKVYMIDSLLKHYTGIVFGQGKKYTYIIYTVNV